MRQLEMEVICAQSPETKFVLKEPIKHDKTIKKKRLRGINDLEKANALLPTYIKAHHECFATT
jgi:hypothetical protein